jgi:hypothetical protein
MGQSSLILKDRFMYYFSDIEKGAVENIGGRHYSKLGSSQHY